MPSRNARLDGPRRVVIDALAARYGGTAYAAVYLAGHLLDTPEVDAVSVVARRGSIVHKELTRWPAVGLIELPQEGTAELLRRLAWEAWRMPRMTSRQHDTIVTFSGMLPRLPRSRLVCLQFNPVMYEKTSAANRIRRLAVRRTCRSASFVAAPSAAMAKLVADDVGRECAVVPLGVDHAVFHPGSARGAEILCVADFYAHKRHDLVLDAWLELPPPRPLLRLIGNPAVDRRVSEALVKRVATLRERDKVIVEYPLSLESLVDAYHRARVFLLPSERESFCLPLVESMACGVPPVVRGIPSLRETGGTGARYVVGNEPADWAAAMHRLLTDDGEHAVARRAAQGAAARFSWATFARTIAATLR